MHACEWKWRNEILWYENVWIKQNMEMIQCNLFEEPKKHLNTFTFGIVMQQRNPNVMLANTKHGNINVDGYNKRCGILEGSLTISSHPSIIKKYVCIDHQSNYIWWLWKGARHVLVWVWTRGWQGHPIQHKTSDILLSEGLLCLYERFGICKKTFNVG